MRSASRCSPIGSMLIDLCLTSVLLLAGQMLTQTPHPVQSSGATWMIARRPGSALSFQSLSLKVAGRSTSASSATTLRRMAAWGQTRAQRAQSMQMSGSQIGISAAMLRFSHLVVPVGKRAVDGQCADRQQIALAGHHPGRHALHEVGSFVGTTGGTSRVLVTSAGISSLCNAATDASTAAVLRRSTTSPRFAVGLGDRRLDRVDRLLRREQPAQVEVTGLQHGVDSVAQTGLAGHQTAVDHPHLELFVDDRALHLGGQLGPGVVGDRTAS